MKIFYMSGVQGRIVRNWAKLFTGSTLGASLGFIAMVIMTHAIGVSDVGIFAIIQTFWRTLEGFLSFQSFQILIKHGADCLHENKKDAFRSLVKICLLADFTMALTGALLGIIGLLLLHDSISIPSDTMPFGLLGAATMITMVTGAHTGVLRLFDEFNVIALRDVVVGILRILLNSLAFILGLKLNAFISIWIITEATGNMIIIYSGSRQLRARGFDNIFGASLRGSSEFGPCKIIKALFTVNFATMIRILSEEGDTLLVNYFMGPGGAGKYKIAKNMANISYKFTSPLIQSVYPEIAKTVSENNRQKYLELFFYTSLQGGILGIFVWTGWFFLGDLIIRSTVGANYSDSLTTVLIISGGYAFGFFGLALNPSLYSFNRLNQYLGSAIFCTLMFFAVSIPLFPVSGANAAAWGQVACYISGLLWSSYIVFQSFQKHNWD